MPRHRLLDVPNDITVHHSWCLNELKCRSYVTAFFFAAHSLYNLLTCGKQYLNKLQLMILKRTQVVHLFIAIVSSLKTMLWNWKKPVKGILESHNIPSVHALLHEQMASRKGLTYSSWFFFLSFGLCSTLMLWRVRVSDQHCSQMPPWFGLFTFSVDVSCQWRINFAVTNQWLLCPFLPSTQDILQYGRAPGAPLPVPDRGH